MYGAFDVVLYFVNPTVLVANKLTSYLSYLILSYTRMLFNTNAGVSLFHIPVTRSIIVLTIVEVFTLGEMIVSQTCHLVRIVRIQYGFWPFLR